MSDEAAAPADGASADAPSPPKKSKAGLVLIGALVGGLVAGAAAGLFAVGPLVARSSGYVVTEEMQARLEAQAKLNGGEGSEHGEADGEEGGADGEEHAAAEGEPKEGEAATAAANLHLIDNLVMNPAGSGGTRFLMLSAAVEFTDAKMVEDFKARDAEVRDLVLRVMGAKTVEQLSDMPSRELIRQEIRDSLAMLLPKATRKKGIAKIFFPQFVIQ